MVTVTEAMLSEEGKKAFKEAGINMDMAVVAFNPTMTKFNYETEESDGQKWLNDVAAFFHGASEVEKAAGNEYAAKSMYLNEVKIKEARCELGIAKQIGYELAAGLIDADKGVVELNQAFYSRELRKQKKEAKEVEQ